MTETLLQVDRLSKRFCRDPKYGRRYALQDIFHDVTLRNGNSALRPKEFWAVKDVSFQVKRGEVVGIIGHNGAGKSTLANLVAGVLRPTAGKVRLNTNKVVILGCQGGLNPSQTGRENIHNQLSIHGTAKHAIRENVEEVIRFSQLEDSIDAPSGTYSLGMKLRLSFGIYSRLKPDLFVADEALNGGDLKFRRRFQEFLDEYIYSGGSILLASHDLLTIQNLCNTCILMDGGKVVSIGKPPEIVDMYQKLMDAKYLCRPSNPGLNETGPVLKSLGLSLPDDDTQAKDVEIESVEVSAHNGGSLKPGGAAIVRIVCTSRESVSPAACWLLIRSADSPLAVVSTQQYELTKGRNVFHCFIDNLPLVPATYHIAVAFSVPQTNIVLGLKGRGEKCFAFDVAGTADTVTNVARYHKCFLHLSAFWKREVSN